MLKTCSKCKKTKPINEFSFKRNQCKECRNELRKECYQNNKEKNREYLKEYYKEYYQNNKDKYQKRSNEYYQNNKKEIQKRSNEYYQNNKKEIKEYQKEYCQNNKKKIKELAKEYYQINKEKIREYFQNNKEKIYEYHRNRRKTDPKYKLNKNISSAIGKSLHGNKNGKHWEDLVGYTLGELKKHLEKQFTDGMTWDNYGFWHIDHSIPLSAFNFTKPEHIGFQRAWALENLQPLWAEENMSKNDKLFYDFQSNLAI